MSSLSDTGKKSIIILSILTALSTLFVFLRLWKRKGVHNIGVDDGLLIFALVMIYAQDAGAFLLAIKGGEGKPFATLTADEMTWLFKMFFWPELGYTILIATIKMSILISYYKIFFRVRWFRTATYILGGLVMIWFFGVFFSVIFQCTPIDKAWKPLKPGHCINLIAFLWGNSVSNNILDWLILFLPVIPVWKLQMDPVQKALVIVSFLLGSVACIASLIRAIFTGTFDLTDPSLSVFKASICTYIEPAVGVIAACLPYLSNMAGQRIRKMIIKVSNIELTTLLRFRSSKGTTQASRNDNRHSRSGRNHRSYEMTDGGDHASTKSGAGATEQNSVKSLV
ncbi:hypothetical protein BGZ60DRAFT_527571 [Tricladium varicosporioides]|nr:hypothetical protein BGZ60DRAFT_527571 [Hymenoscyphus varicosporioides]